MVSFCCDQHRHHVIFTCRIQPRINVTACIYQCLPSSRSVVYPTVTIMPTSFQIQDLAKLCSEHFEPRANQHCRVVNDATCRWVDEYGFLEEEERARLPDMQIALLAAMCFPTCDMPQLKTAEDLLMILFHWQDKPERVDEAADQAAFQKFVVVNKAHTGTRSIITVYISVSGIG